MSIEDLTKLSRYYGANPEYVIAGGGNTSFKDGTTLYVKGSGAALADMTPEGFVRMDRQALSRIWEKDYPPDPEERERAVLADMMAARKSGEEQKRPSVETLLHDMLPFTYVVHTHPALVNGLTCSQQGQAEAAELFGPEFLWIPSTNPGYILSRAVKTAMEEYMAQWGCPADLILLQNHGVFVGADSVQEMKEKYAHLMVKLELRMEWKPDFSGELSNWDCSGDISGLLAELAGSSAGGEPWKVVFRRNNEIAIMVKDRASFHPVSSSFTPDHIVYAGSDPLFVETGTGSIQDCLREAWKNHLDTTRRIPKIAAVQGVGVFGIGPTEKAANLALELFMDAIKVAVYAQSFGGERFMSRDQIDFINNWEVERYRSTVSAKS
ncbi:MAG: class II aldolase/adducin family protein [Treponema sp.]|jgi:rhamnose utilization protein RhaD (predicted bifunctional aldolase and dehydrogenase)|nr:class II aldolase/adducin family protein [Treponema sp.]